MDHYPRCMSNSTAHCTAPHQFQRVRFHGPPCCLIGWYPSILGPFSCSMLCVLFEPMHSNACRAQTNVCWYIVPLRFLRVQTTSLLISDFEDEEIHESCTASCPTKIMLAMDLLVAVENTAKLGPTVACLGSNIHRGQQTRHHFQ